MNPRTILQCLAIALCPALIGCGAASGTPAAKGPVSTVRTAAQAKKDLLSIAKRIEDPGAFAAMEAYIAQFEDPEKDCETVGYRPKSTN